MSDPFDSEPWSETPPPDRDAILTVLVATVLSSAVQVAVEIRVLVERASGRSRETGVEPISPLVDAAFDVALRATTVVADGAAVLGRLGRRVVLLTPQPPIMPYRFWPLTALAQSVERGRKARVQADRISRQMAGDLVVRLLDEVLDRIDLTQLVLDRVDIGDVVAGIDLGGIAKEVIDEIDLPEIIRESSGAMASETVLGMRIRGIEADERVNKAISRVLLRRRDPDTVALQPEGESDG